MKKIILFLLAFVLLGGLILVYIPFTPSEPAVGADRDAHGCIGSAGYTYSVVRGACIRVWEAGEALTPVVSAGDPVMAAYVVQNENGQQAEMFLPGFEQSLLLTRDPNAEIATWTAPGGWILTYDPDQGWKFAQQGQLLYASKGV